MNQIVISLCIGIGAAVIDTIPMIIQRLDRSFIFSAFSFWVVVGLLIPKATFVQAGWANGLVVAVLVMIPLAFLIAKLDRTALPLVVATTLVLGSVAGYLSERLLG